MKTIQIRALLGAGALSLAFLGGIAFAPALVSGAAAHIAGPQTPQTGDERGRGTDPLAVAAQYIDITAEALRSEMGTTKSIADVAVAHGKTRDGLIQALVTAETQNLSQRVTQLVDHKGAPQRPGPGFRPGGQHRFGPRGPRP